MAEEFKELVGRGSRNDKSMERSVSYSSGKYHD